MYGEGPSASLATCRESILGVKWGTPGRFLAPAHPYGLELMILSESAVLHAVKIPNDVVKRCCMGMGMQVGGGGSTTNPATGGRAALPHPQLHHPEGQTSLSTQDNINDNNTTATTNDVDKQQQQQQQQQQRQSTQSIPASHTPALPSSSSSSSTMSAQPKYLLRKSIASMRRNTAGTVGLRPGVGGMLNRGHAGGAGSSSQSSNMNTVNSTSSLRYETRWVMITTQHDVYPHPTYPHLLEP